MATKCEHCGTVHTTEESAYGAGYCRDCGDYTNARANNATRVCAVCGGKHSTRKGKRRYCKDCGDFTPSTRFVRS